MIKTAIILFFIVSLSACTTTESALDTKYPDRVQVNPPQRTAYVEKDIHIRTVEKLQLKNNTALVIEGDFPNPCTQILRVDDKRFPQTFSLKIIGWQKYQEVCMQTITPFTFVYQNEEAPIEKINSVTINGISIDLKNNNTDHE